MLQKLLKSVGKSIAGGVIGGGGIQAVQEGAVMTDAVTETEPLLSAVLGAVTALVVLVRELRKARII